MLSILRYFGAIGLLCAIVACSSSSTSTVTPPPGPTNPSSTTISVTVHECHGNPPTCVTGPGTDVPVTLSTGWDSSTRTPTGVITKQKTDAKGDTTFSSLPSHGELCVSAVVVGTGTHVRAYCAQPFPATYLMKFDVSS
jgi:hypothetical protein